MPEAEQPVPLGDLEVAQRIAASVRAGGRAEREPTLEQLLAAFGHGEPTTDARRRARSALRIAGVSVLPDLGEAPPGSRVRLLVAPAPAGAAGGIGRLLGARGPGLSAALGGLALVVVVAGAVLAATLSGGDGGKSAGEALSGGTATTPVAGGTGTVSGSAVAGGAPATTATVTTTAARATTATAATPSTVTATAPTAPTAPAAATVTVTTTMTATTTTPVDVGASAPRPSADRRRAAARRHAPTPPRALTVRVRPTRPTYLCADTGPGTTPLFAGILATPKAFRGRRIRLNVGLSSTQVVVNGKPVVLTESPTGLDITRTRRTQMPLNARPGC